jgi:hypothetical protein
VLHAPLADLAVVDVEGDEAAGPRLGRVGGELEPHVDPPARQRLGRLLLVHVDAHHAVGVLEPAVLDEEREAAQVIRLGDDHPLDAVVRDFQVGADRVGVVVVRGSSPGDVLDLAVVGELRLFAERGRHAEEQRAPAATG